MVFIAENIGQYGVFSGLGIGDKAHSYAGYRLLYLDTGIHKRQSTCANSSHRRRTVGLQNIGYNAHSVRAILRYHGLKSAESQITVAYLAAGNPAHRLGFTGGIRREVIMQVKTFLVFERHAVHFVCIQTRTESYGSERLCFAACENGRTVRHRQCIDHAPDGTYLVRFAAVQTYAFVEYQVAYGFFFDIVVV